MAAKAIVVFDSSGPVPIYEVELGITQFIQNPDGYSVFDNPKATYVRVLATNYLPAVYPVVLDGNNQTIRIGGTKVADNDIMLPALTKSFNKPSRDQIVNVKANFCNLFDSSGLPIFEDFIDTLISENDSRANDWVNYLKSNGSTHLTVTLTGDYPENLGWNTGTPNNRYPIAGQDWTNRLSDFGNILSWIQQRNLIPIVKLGFDGLGYDPSGLTYGWQWGMDNIDRIIIGLSDHIDRCLWSTGFDGCFPTWNPDQTIQMLSKMRAVLGEQACIDTEFAGPGSISYCHMGNGAADWSDDKLGLLDCFSLELETNPAQADGISEVATRILGPNAKNCPTIPYYLEGTSKKINMCFFETVAYWFIHKQTDDYLTPANLGKYYGFTSFGNGLPNG